MTKRWSIPSMRISGVFIKVTGNFFEQRSFSNRIHTCFLVFSMINLFRNLVSLITTLQEGEDAYKLIIDLLISIYSVGIIAVFGSNHKEVAELIYGFNSGLFTYSSYHLCPEDERQLKKIRDIIYLAERVILTNTVKAISAFVIWPIYFLVKNEVCDHAILDGDILWLGLTREVLASVYRWGDFLLSVMFCGVLCIYHNSWQILLVSCVCCLQGELKILSGSIATVDKRAQDMYLTVFRSCTRWDDQKLCSLRELCLFECMRESIRHHQKIIRTAATLNKVISVCMFLYAQTVAASFALALFLAVQSKHMFSLDVLLISLIILPTLLSEYLLCLFGQILQDESEKVLHSLYGCNWQGKSQRFISCLRVMMSQALKPLRLRAVIYNVNMSNYVEFLKAAYSLLNFLITMNASKSSDNM